MFKFLDRFKKDIGNRFRFPSKPHKEAHKVEAPQTLHKLYGDTVRIDLEMPFKKLWKVYVLEDGRFIKHGQTANLEEAFEIAKTLKENT